jgi:hypothetical protein
MYRIAISFAAAAIGISCIATDASARGGSQGGSSHSVGIHSTPAIPAGNASGAPGTNPGSGGGGAPSGGRSYYAPGSYNTACGHYPYPPCKKVPAR